MQSDIAAAAAVLEPSHPLEPYPVASTAPSSEKEIRSSSSLMRYIDEVAPLVTLEEWGRREALLQEILVIFRRWVARVATEKGAYADEETAMEAGGSMFVSGSYKLNVSDKNSDIDTICVAPSMVSRADFFDSLPKLLKQQPGVTALNAIATAKVPIIELEIYGVSVDLQFVSLPVSVVPRTLNILDDNVLLGLDAASVRTLNGPRVNQLIHRLVSNFDTFKGVVRVLRLWGKARGLYGNKNGYFGGVNFAILAAFICQLYPNRCVAGCVHQFFQTMKDWPWPRAIYINRPYTTPLNYEIWDPEHNRNHQSDVMPILTPAYPCMNSLDKACKSTLAVMMTEFVRGYEICQRILSNPHVEEHTWAELVAPTEFFLRFDKYLVLDITAGTEEELKKWQGWVGSRIRNLVQTLENEYLPFKTIYPYPGEVAHAPWQKRSALSAIEDKPTSAGVVPLEPSMAAPEIPIATTTDFSTEDASNGPLAADKAAPLLPDAAPLAGWGEEASEKLDISEATGGAVGADESFQTESLLSPAASTAEDTKLLDAASVHQPPQQVTQPRVVSWFIGILLDPEKVKGTTVNLARPIHYFMFDRKGVMSYKEKTESMKIDRAVFSWHELPDEIFPNGRALAEQQRIIAREWFNAHSTITPYNVLKINRLGNTYVASQSPALAAGQAELPANSPKKLIGIPGLRCSTRIIMLPTVIVPAPASGSSSAGYKRPLGHEIGSQAKRPRMDVIKQEGTTHVAAYANAPESTAADIPAVQVAKVVPPPQIKPQLPPRPVPPVMQGRPAPTNSSSLPFVGKLKVVLKSST